MQVLDKEIAENYGLDVKNIVPYKDTWLAVTQQGRKVVRKIPLSPGRLKFVHGAKEHLICNGFTGVDRYLCTLSGEPFFNFDNSCYTLIDFVDGRESSFDNDGDVQRAAISLAEMHRASRGYVAPAGCKVQNDLGKLPVYFKKRLEDIKKLKKQAKKGTGRFDQLFLQYADFFIDLGEKSIAELAASNYDRLAENTGKEGLFCHHDYTHHNIMMAAETTVIMNFDYCCHELKVYDIANFIRRKMRKCEWDISKSEIIINSYNSREKLDENDLDVMRIILQFPQKFWRVINRYYNSRRSWSEKSFVNRLQEVIDETGPHMQFLKDYSRFC